MPTFEPGKSYPIDTLPDDLHDETIPNRDRWAIRDVLFWNSCQGWWHGGVSEYWTAFHLSEHGHMARFWSPEPADPMTREEMLAEQGEVVCPDCDYAIDPTKPHDCRPSEHIAIQRRLQAEVDSRG